MYNFNTQNEGQSYSKYPRKSQFSQEYGLPVPFSSESEVGAELQIESSITISVLCCLLFPSLCLQPQARSSPIYVAIYMQIRGYFQMYSAPCRRQGAFKNVFFPRIIVRLSVSILLILHLLAGCCSWCWFTSILKPSVSYTSLHPTEILSKFPSLSSASHPIHSPCWVQMSPLSAHYKSQEPAPNWAHIQFFCTPPSTVTALWAHFISLSIIISVFPGLLSATYDNACAISILALFLLNLDSFYVYFYFQYHYFLLHTSALSYPSPHLPHKIIMLLVLLMFPLSYSSMHWILEDLVISRKK